MAQIDIPYLMSHWCDEFITNLIKSQSLCVALFSSNGELIFANDSISAHFKGIPSDSFINPTFNNLLKIETQETLIFEGFLTLGDFISVNNSIWAQVYRKEDKILVLGGINAATLLEQNETMHHLNREINNMQRELIKEKHSLEKTLNKLNEANAQLKKLNADKDRFIAILGHDLKNPFNSILGLTGLLEEDIQSLDNGEITEIAKNINRSATYTNKLLDDILLWAKAQQGKIPFSPQTYNFVSVCGESIEVQLPVAKAKNITVEVDAPDGSMVYADIYMLKTVLRNLVSNSIKFTNSGGIIKIHFERKGDVVWITVEDNGIGVPPENMGKLFNISEVVTTKGTRSETGTGLGLLLCKEFVEQHGGKIWAESSVGSGSKFIFTLPDKGV